MDKRCVIIGGADIADYGHIRGYLNDGDYLICCDSGLKHRAELGIEPDLIIGDFDSYDNPHADIETITLPVAKDDTDTMYAIKEGVRRGFTDFLLLGVLGNRFDHSLVNLYALFWLDDKGCTALAADDYSELSVIHEGNTAYVDDCYPYFSLLSMTGTARGVTIHNAKFELEDAEITASYQYATSNEVIPGMKAEISVREGRLLLAKILRKL